MPKQLLIDGTTLEGGGQLIRLAVGLSAITGKSIGITNIRGGRPRGGGLKAQHLTAVKWLASACNACIEGAEVGSRTLVFEPGYGSRKSSKPLWDRTTTLADGTKVREVVIDLHGLGAATLVLQAILPFILLTGAYDGSANVTEQATPLPILLTLKGGTNVSFSPSIEYVEQVFIPNMAIFGFPEIKLQAGSRLRRGWSLGRAQPGEVSYLICPIPDGGTLPPLLLPPRRGRVTKIDINVLAYPATTRQLVLQRTQKALSEHMPLVKQETVFDEDSGDGKRMYLLLVAHTESGFRIGCDKLYDGKIGKTNTAVENAVDALVKRTVMDLVAELGGDHEGATDGLRCLDSHMEDQVVVYMALAGGRSRCERVAQGGAAVARGGKDGPTLHTRTAQWLVGELLGVKFDEDGSCKGVGICAGNDAQRVSKRLTTVEGLESMVGGLNLEA